MKLRAGLVICACGWSGELGWDAPCPACARPAIDRMSPARIAALRGVRDRDAPLDRMMRIRLIQIGSLRPAGKRPARGADGRIYRGTRNRSHVVTPLGLAALATADRLDAERRAAEQGRHDVAASVPTEEESAAVKLEILYLEPHCATDEGWDRAALAGPCFCAGRFICTRHLIEARLS